MHGFDSSPKHATWEGCSLAERRTRPYKKLSSSADPAWLLGENYRLFVKSGISGLEAFGIFGGCCRMRQETKKPFLQPYGGTRPARQVTREPLRESLDGALSTHPAQVAVEAARQPGGTSSNIRRPKETREAPPSHHRQWMLPRIGTALDAPFGSLAEHHHIPAFFRGKTGIAPHSAFSA